MKVTIWDLDYYFALDRRNKHNTDVMKIASYHKQLGDSVNFVTKEADINRPYDCYYVIKNNKKTPNPPLSFFSNRKVRWYGEAFKSRQNWTISDTILACRPDYLLYPELDTRIERAEKIRLLGNNRTLLPIVQDWSNSFKNKDIIVTDPELWFAAPEVVKEALEELSQYKGISFEHPIWWPKLINNPDILEAFFNLDLNRNSKLRWNPIYADFAAQVIDLLVQLKLKFPGIQLEVLPIKYSRNRWITKDNAIKGFSLLMDIVVSAKEKCIPIKIIAPKTRYDTPFYFLPELMEEWSESNFKLSWIEFLSKKYKVNSDFTTGFTEWNKPYTWPPLFRDALRQTWFNKKFLLLQWGESAVSENEIPWKMLEEQFTLGL